MMQKCIECEHLNIPGTICKKGRSQNTEDTINLFKCEDYMAYCHLCSNKDEEDVCKQCLNSNMFETTIMDNVNNPRHYNSHPSGVECKEIIRHMNFNLGSAIKYVWRAGLKNKDTEIEDLKKAVSCIQDEIKRLEDWGNDTTRDSN